MSIRFFFRWYDLWLGAYWDCTNRTLYICPFPMFGIQLQFANRRNDQRLQIAKEYVDKQLKTMEEFGSASKEMSRQEYRLLVQEIAETVKK